MSSQMKTSNTSSITPKTIEVDKENIDMYFASESSIWNNIYQKEDVYSVIHQDRRSTSLQYIKGLPLPQHPHILEIGCGAGLTSVDLARLGYTIEAVDRVEDMIDLTRQNAIKFGVEEQIHTGVMDASNLEFPDQTFDLVIALGVVPWLPDLMKALNEISRVLVPGGFVLINMDNRWRLNHVLDPIDFPPFSGLKANARTFLEKARLRKFSSAPRPQRHTIKEFDTLLESVSLVKMKHRMIGFGPFSFLKIPLFRGTFGIQLHRYLQNAADHGIPLICSTGSQYLVLAQKK